MQELLEAIQHDSLVKMKKLLESGKIDLTQEVIIGDEYELDEPDETNILFWSIREGASLEAIELLVEYGVDITQTDRDGICALDMAIKFKREDLVEYCIAKGIDPNTTKRKSGMLPILLAACFRDTSMVEILLKNGVDINATDGRGMSAMDYAKKLGQKKMLEYLESKGAKHSIYT
jgi:ankyrin repeat protein